MLQDVSVRYAEKEAIVFENQRITYAELLSQVKRYARAFLSAGVQKDDKVSVWLNNCPEWIYIQLAMGLIGAVLVPVNTRFKINELEYTLKQSDSKILITMDSYRDIRFADMVYQAVPELKESPAVPYDLKNYPKLKYVICQEDKPMPGMMSLENFLAKGDDFPEKNLMARQKEVKPDDVVMFQYTSGTTSFPKGVMLTHNSTLQDSFSMGTRMNISDADRLFCPLPFFHVGGAVISTLLTLQKGGTLVICEAYTPEGALELVQKERCTAMNGIETHFLMMYTHPNFVKYDVSTLQRGWAIGPPEILRNVYEVMGMKEVVNVFGISEASPNVTLSDINEPLEHRMAWHGKPHEGTELKIVDPDTEEVKPPWQEGEICVRGWNVMKGYYNKPEETKAVLDEDGWLHTGDFGILDDEGNLKYMGRFKDIVRVGGENVSAMEVENFILTHPKVKNVSIIGVPDDRLTEVCMAIIQLREGEETTEEAIIEYCKGKIAGFKVPRHVAFIDEFPMTGSGKIQKVVLKERYGFIE